MATATSEIIKSEEQTAIAFGDRGELRELAYRLRTMMPNAQKLSENEALAVAQVARAHDLDPFTGEVWGLKSKDGTWYGVMVGIKGQRKSATREADKEGGTYWMEHIQVDPTKYGATNKPGSIVFECILRDTVKVQAWGKSINILTTAGVPYKDALEMLGKCPQVIGIGIADPSENSKMALYPRAKKRAEADAIKQRYSISFGAGVVVEGSKDIAAEVEQVAEQFSEENTVDGKISEIVTPAEKQDNEAERLRLEAEYHDACEVLDSKNNPYRAKSDDDLGWVIKNPQSPEEKKRAATVILNWRNAERAAQARENKIVDELGY